MEINDSFIENLAVSQSDITEKISRELDVTTRQVSAAIGLLKDDNTIPFISRYRKEATGALDEVAVRDISHRLTALENLEQRRIDIIRLIYEQGQLSDVLLTNITKANTLAELEDLYAPFKKKKKTRGMIAVEKGLQKLAEIIEKESDDKIEAQAPRFINPEKEVHTAEEAIAGAQDIVAENTAHDIDKRKRLKEFVLKHGVIVVKGLKDEDASVYKMYYDFKEPLSQVKPHRVLAINRGEKEKELQAKIDFDDDTCCRAFLTNFRINSTCYRRAIEDGLTRLLVPAVLREIRSDFTEAADAHGITLFATNLSNLLMQPPIKKTRVLGVDPGIRTGTKAAAVDTTGKFLGYFTFFQHKTEEAKKCVHDNIVKYKIELVAVGNGTGSHEVQTVITDVIKEYNLPLKYTVVSEDGASVYSASKLAGEEFPDLDVTIRGAISIARRLQDPLSELVKIDSKSIGVGLYQHDVNQKKLSESLHETVESVVNNVGVNLNTASSSLLQYVSGITAGTAKKIVTFREKNGIIKNREMLKKVPGMGEKTFEQCAGFIKIPESDNPLDNTWVHPEQYGIATEIYRRIKNESTIGKEETDELARLFGVSESAVHDIIQEIKKPNRDPRQDFPAPILQDGVVSFEDLAVGMKVTGKIKNVVDFGAFVDIGIKETALLHISQISDTYIKNPMDVLKVGDVKEVEIIDIDAVRKRISVSLKTLEKPI